MFPIDEYLVTSTSLVWCSLAYAFMLLLAFIFTIACRRKAKKAEGRRTKIFYQLSSIGIYLLTFTVGTVALNSAVYSISTYYDDTYAPVVTAVEAVDIGYGLKSGEAYPLILGGRVEGTSGRLNVSAGLFQAKASTSLAPASVITIEYVHLNKSYPLEIPVTMIEFNTSTTETPSVTLLINPVGEHGTYGTRIYDTSRPCKSIVKTAVVVCHRVITSTVKLSQKAQNTRPGDLLKESVGDIPVLQAATFVGTPAMKSQIMGTDG